MAENDAILNLTIATPEGILFQGKVDSVKLPGTKSAFMVLPLHAPIISSLSKGIVTYAQGNESTSVDIKGGFVQVKSNDVSVCVEI
jgi:F-type H+-transporting ATPase subunit epsilon